MKLPKLTKRFIQNELYKFCAGREIQIIIGQYSPKSKWYPHDIIKVAIHACLEQSSIEDLSSTPETPSPDRVHDRFSELQLQQVEQLLNHWLQDVGSRLYFHKNTKITVSIDLYQQPYYGDPTPDWVTTMKRKKGTNYAISFLIISVSTGKIRFPIAVRLMTRQLMSAKPAVVGELLDKLRLWLPITRVLLDRGFCSEEMKCELEQRGLKYVMAAIRRSGVKKAYREIVACSQELAAEAGINVKDRLALGRWVRSQGLDTFQVTGVRLNKQASPSTLVAVWVRHKTHNRDPKKRRIYSLFLYLTNCQLSPRYIVRLYGKRWIVETDIRCMGEFKAVTNSTSPQLRLFFQGLTMLFDSLWVVFSTLVQRHQNQKITAVTKETQWLIKQADQLVCIARWFKRWLRDDIFPEMFFRGGDA